MSTAIALPVDQVVWRQDLYPRIKQDPALVQRYAEDLAVLPPIEVNQHNILIDGWHRWTAHRQEKQDTIQALVTETDTEDDLFALAIERNAAFGWQLDEESKKAAAIRLYRDGYGLAVDRIRIVLSASERTVYDWLSKAIEQHKEQRRRKIFEMWLACYTQEEIEAAVPSTAPGTDQATISTDMAKIKTSIDKCDIAGFNKSRDFAFEPDWTPPLYNIWSFGKKTNEVSHFGNSEQRIVENLLYLYTNPFDIVLDPFAGGGATIDVCRKRLRRYWVSDRKPTVARETEIRPLDIVADLPPLHKRWSEVALTYLDPPYWRQAKGKYSDDAEDLANMPLDKFTASLASVVKRIASKQSRGAIALLMQPTQWHADERQVVDHVCDLVQAVGNKRLRLEYRVSCPYSTEQYTPQMVDWAKENKKLLVLTRELIIWRVQERD